MLAPMGSHRVMPRASSLRSGLLINQKACKLATAIAEKMTFSRLAPVIFEVECRMIGKAGAQISADKNFQLTSCSLSFRRSPAIDGSCFMSAIFVPLPPRAMGHFWALFPSASDPDKLVVADSARVPNLLGYLRNEGAL